MTLKDDAISHFPGDAVALLVVQSVIQGSEVSSLSESAQASLSKQESFAQSKQAAQPKQAIQNYVKPSSTTMKNDEMLFFNMPVRRKAGELQFNDLKF